MNNILQLERNSCVSCRSCEHICPKKCISFSNDEQGFSYPQLNDECINCGICVKHCPILTLKLQENQKQTAKAMILKNTAILQKSSSGGVFAGIAEYVIENDGIVFGAAFDKNFCLKQVAAKTMEEITVIQGSKYVVSDTVDSYSEVKQYLDCGKLVLYSGVPCQIAGLKSFLGKEYENLLCIDLVCHGVPSQILFRNYLNNIENKAGKKIKSYEFRKKIGSEGWGIRNTYILFEDGSSKKNNIAFDWYYSSFLFCESYRESCYNCKFARPERIGDITIGDFWGFRRFYNNTDINYRAGVSMCLINNGKGLKYFNYFKDKFITLDANLEDITLENVNLREPSVRPEMRNVFYEKFESHLFRFKLLFEKRKLKWLIGMTINQFIPKWLKKCIRKVRG